MARSVFKKDIEAQCKYCEFGSVSADKSAVLCQKAGGVMQPFSKCRKFKYDPFKREPKFLSFNNSEFEKDDFSL